MAPMLVVYKEILTVIITNYKNSLKTDTFTQFHNSFSSLHQTKLYTEENLIFTNTRINQYYHCHHHTMLLRSSISKYKKFFQKTLQKFKLLFSPSYQKLPKTHSSYSVAAAVDNNQSYKDLEKFYSDFTEQWDSEKGNARRRSKKKVVISSPPKQEKEVYTDESFIGLNSEQQNKNQMEKREEYEDQKNKRSLTHQRKDQKDSSFNNCKRKRGNSNCMVEKKLRELEMLDKSDVDYILDIEEVLHYYSRLTCPAYLEIVDKFFTEMCSEFFVGGPEEPAIPHTAPGVDSKLKLRSVRS